MLLCLRQFPTPLLESVLDKICGLRTTRLSRRPCTRRGFPGNPCRCRARQPHHQPLLMTTVAPLPWCRGCRTGPDDLFILLLSSRVRRRRGRKGKAPFSSASGRSWGKRGGAGKQSSWRGLSTVPIGGCLSARWRHWQAIGAESWALSILRDG